MAALAPMPSASVTTAVNVNAGLFASARTACLRSLMRGLDVKTYAKVVRLEPRQDADARDRSRAETARVIACGLRLHGFPILLCYRTNRRTDEARSGRRGNRGSISRPTEYKFETGHPRIFDRWFLSWRPRWNACYDAPGGDRCT